MISKSLFFKLVKEDIKHRIWLFAISMLSLFFACPVAVAVFISESNNTALPFYMKDIDLITFQRANIYKLFSCWYGIKGFYIIFVITMLAIVAGVSGFAYLYNARKTDFWHGMPIKRKRLFAAKICSSVLIVWVPYILMSIIATAIALVKTGRASCIEVMLIGLLIHFSQFMLVYGTTVLVIILTGNFVAGLCGLGMFSFFLPAVVEIGVLLFEEFHTFVEDGIKIREIMYHVSPIMWVFYSDTTELSKIVCSLVWTFILLVAAEKLYEKRNSEAAGRAMAFRITESPIRIVSVLAVSIVAYFFGDRTFDTKWGIFAFIIGLLLSHCIIEIIYNSDFKKLFNHKLQMIICGAVACVIIVIFKLDIFGYDTYRPDVAKIDSVGINSYILENNQDLYNTNLDISEDLEYPSVYYRYDDNIADITDNMAITDETIINSLPDYLVENDCVGTHTKAFYVTYHMKSGRNIRRLYQIDEYSSGELMAMIYNNQDYKEATYPIFQMDESEIVGINYTTLTDIEHLKCDDKNKMRELFETYKEEFTDLTYETRGKENPTLCLQFKDKEFQKKIDIIRKRGGDVGSFNTINYYPVYPSFTKTIALLKEYGIDYNSKYEIADNMQMKIIDYLSDSYDTDEAERADDYIVTDKKEIEEILSNSICTSFIYSNRINPIFYGLEIQLYASPAEDVEYSDYDYSRTAYFYFKTDSIPEYIKEKYSLTDDIISNESE